MVRTSTAEPFESREAPLDLAADPGFFFRSRTHGAALDLLRSAIRRGDGLVVLIGEMGSGKTTVCRALLEDLDGRTFVAFAPSALLSESELLALMLEGFGVVRRHATAWQRLAVRPAHELVDALGAFLFSLVPLRARAIVIIDEAQHLSAEVLERIRLLSNLETGRRKLLQVVLAGQPALESRLRSTGGRALDHRVSVRARLDPLTPMETAAYVDHRLRIAGSSAEVRFSEGALSRVYRRSGGNPRLVNLLCAGVLAAARAAGSGRVSSDLVSETAAVLDIRRPAPAWVVQLGRLATTMAAGVAASMLLGSAAAGLTGLGVRGDLALTPSVGVVWSGQPVGRDIERIAGVDRSRFSILAGSFDDVEHASLVRRRLVRLGYDAYQVFLDNRTPRVQVWVGDYTDEAEARQDERLLRRTPGFDAARLVRFRP